MFIALNVIIILLVGLIAYWWANQGLFSALLHLVCVIVAGALAFGFWELLTVGVVLNGSGFDPYAWGVVLIGLFVIALFVLRVAMDKLVPNNIDLPHWANLTFGLPVGAIAGIITMGIFLIGAGHLQSASEIMEYKGYARSDRTGQVEKVNSLWLPVHTITSEFYSWLSVSSMLTPKPLRHVNPDLDKQVTLIRDTWGKGRGQVTIHPDAVEVTDAVMEGNQVDVRVAFDGDARDFKERLTLSQSQVRLIGDADGLLLSGEAPVVLPEGWTQESGRYRFESISFYASSVPGQEGMWAIFHFRVPAGFTPRYIQIKGTRFNLPTVEQGGTIGTGIASESPINRGAPNICQAISLGPDVRRIRSSVNALGSMSHLETYLWEGDQAFSGESSVRGANRIKGIYTPDGTEIVQVRVDWSSPANIFVPQLRQSIPDDAEVALYDTQGNAYTPIGFMHLRSDRQLRVVLNRRGEVDRFNDLPQVPSGGEQELTLLFSVTEGATIDGLQVGPVTVGICNMEVERQRRR